MTLTGHVENGVVVFEGKLPEGARVWVSPLIDTQTIERNGIQVVLPMIPGGVSGSLMLTGDAIAELLEHEDASA